MIVTVLGGSAPSTPQLFRWLAGKQLRSPLTVRLAGRDPDRLAAVVRASRICAGDSDLAIQEFSKGVWDEALQGADVVLIQVRAGGLPWRQFDETFPLEFGVPGDEGLGPGGLSAALRNWPLVCKILSQLRKSAASCITILLTSPGSLLTCLAALQFPDLRVYSICELPLTTLRNICRHLPGTFEQVRFSYAGVNHLGWLYDMNCGGADLIESYLSTSDANGFRQVIGEYGAIPLQYLRLHFHREQAVAEQRRSGPAGCRAARLSTIQRDALRVFAQGSRAEISQALDARRAPWYTDAVGPLLLNLCGSTDPGRDSSMPFFLSTVDECGEVFEKPYVTEGSFFRPLPVKAPPTKVHALNSRYAEYERTAAASLQQPNRNKLATALMIHPWISEKQTAIGLADAAWRGFEAFSASRDHFTWAN